MQGFSITSMSVGPQGTVFATEDGQAFVYTDARGEVGAEGYEAAKVCALQGLGEHRVLQVAVSLDAAVNFSFVLTKEVEMHVCTQARARSHDTA